MMKRLLNFDEMKARLLANPSALEWFFYAPLPEDVDIAVVYKHEPFSEEQQYEIALAVVRDYGFCVELVPMHLRTYEMFVAAVRSGYAFSEVPQEFQDENLLTEFENRYH
jgi:hypothetical protein